MNDKAIDAAAESLYEFRRWGSDPRWEHLGSHVKDNYRDDARAAIAAYEAALWRPGLEHVDIVFDGPPSPFGPQFIEVEDAHGKSISFGQWVKRDDGFHVLRIRPLPLPPESAR